MAALTKQAKTYGSENVVNENNGSKASASAK